MFPSLCVLSYHKCTNLLLFLINNLFQSRCSYNFPSMLIKAFFFTFFEALSMGIYDYIWRFVGAILQTRLHEEHERCLLYLDASTRKPLIASAEKQLLERHISAILDKVSI